MPYWNTRQSSHIHTPLTHRPLYWFPCWVTLFMFIVWDMLTGNELFTIALSSFFLLLIWGSDKREVFIYESFPHACFLTVIVLLLIVSRMAWPYFGPAMQVFFVINDFAIQCLSVFHVSALQKPVVYSHAGQERLGTAILVGWVLLGQTCCWIFPSQTVTPAVWKTRSLQTFVCLSLKPNCFMIL